MGDVTRSLQETVDEQVALGRSPGVVALVATGDRATVAVAGERTIGGPPMTRDTLFRLASITKPITAAATMALVERGRFGLEDPVAPWLPELADPVVLRSLDADLDDVIPALRPITVRHLLTFQGGHGLPSDLAAPVAQHMLAEGLLGPPRPQEAPPMDEWLARLARVPLLHQPGEGWTYDAGSDLLGVLLSRAEDSELEGVLRDTVLDPLGMDDTSFTVAPTAVDRLGTLYRRQPGGGFEVVDPPEGQWAAPPPFPSGAGGLVSTVDDWSAFGRMLLADGAGPGVAVLSPESVRLMTTNHVELGPENPVLQGQGWGFGGSVDVTERDPWNVVGRYGWIGGTGTAGFVIPGRAAVCVVLTQVEMEGPDDFSTLAEVLTWVATETAP